MTHFDTKGDIHGQAGKLERLFRVLGYEKIGGVYGSAGRKAVFVGDLIDRGPAIGETLEIVKLWPERLAVTASHSSEEFRCLDGLLKGIEIELPAGLTYLDKEGQKRSSIRIK